MKKPKLSGKGSAVVDSETVRASISFPTSLYRALEERAKQKKVSLAWIVRDAAEKYVEEQAPEVTGARR
jgi:metal-responsive CopG/Arc/MetJ family transcriptional regulator